MGRLLIISSLLLSKSMLTMSDLETEFRLLESSEHRAKEQVLTEDNCETYLPRILMWCLTSRQARED